MNWPGYNVKLPDEEGHTDEYNIKVRRNSIRIHLKGNFTTSST